MPLRIHALLALLLSLPCLASAQAIRVNKVEPPNWWTGMRHNHVQLMLYGEGLQNLQAHFNDPRIVVEKVHAIDNAHYAFVDIHIPADLPSADYQLMLTGAGQGGNDEGPQTETSIRYPILARQTAGPPRHRGFSSDDVICLITPDRFANGDRTNDRVAGVLDEFDPTNNRMRHGGDLRGIVEHLDYLQDLGITALWLNPVLENKGVNSYHGYKATDLYRIDPRFGSNVEYQQFVTAAHQRGIKVIFDHVANHIGLQHPWIDNLPTQDWLNGSVEDHLSEKHYLLSITAPHADLQAQQQLKQFWFVDKMPDLNQRNPFLAKYLIQNSIWWIETTGLDGIREDTYPYADQTFLSNWAKAIRSEYPQFNIVGEIWATKSAYIAQFQDKTVLPRDFETNLPALMDFPLMQAYRDFLAGKSKLRDIYEVYAQDFLFTDPDNLLVFLDNHDTPRALFLAQQNEARVKLALSIMLLSRGIPQLLYGTEINMLGGASHVELRADFTGGFPNATRDAFTKAGRTDSENEMHTFMKRLIQLRKQHPAITQGSMIHYAPVWNEDVYKFIRKADNDMVLVVANGESEQRQVDLSDLQHHVEGRVLRDAFTGEVESGIQQVRVAGLTARVFEVVSKDVGTTDIPVRRP